MHDFDSKWSSRVVDAATNNKIAWPPVTYMQLTGINAAAFQYNYGIDDRTKLFNRCAAMVVQKRYLDIEPTVAETSLVVHNSQQLAVVPYGPEQEVATAVHTWSADMQQLQERVAQLEAENTRLKYTESCRDPYQVTQARYEMDVDIDMTDTIAQHDLTTTLTRGEELQRELTEALEHQKQIEQQLKNELEAINILNAIQKEQWDNFIGVPELDEIRTLLLADKKALQGLKSTVELTNYVLANMHK